MKVTSDGQTLILAGETPPRRHAAGRAIEALESDAVRGDLGEIRVTGRSSQRVTIISARLDAIVTQGDLIVAAPGAQLPALATSALPASSATLHQAYIVSDRTYAAFGADAYARTRDLSDKIAIIDTYA